MSLYELQKESLIQDFKSFQSYSRHLIVDDTTYPLVNQLFKDDILNYAYTYVKIDGERSLNRDRALYLLDPVSPYTMSCLEADFSQGQRYQDIVVMFLPGLTRTIWEKLMKNKHFVLAMNQKNYVTVNYLSLNPVENRVFVTGNIHSIPVYYNYQKHGNDLLDYQFDTSINAMMSLCLLTNEYPTVRYYNSKISRKLAHEFQKRLDEYYRTHSDLTPVNNKTVFFITDRTMDLFGPVCHYKFYRSQIYDLMDEKIQKTRGVYSTATYNYEVKTGEGLVKKSLEFGNEDPVYTQIRDLTIEEFTVKIQEMFDDLKKEDRKFNNLQYVSDIKHAQLNKDTHAFNKTVITGHYMLINKIIEEFEKETVLDYIVFENKCATGLGPLKDLYEPLTDELIQLLSTSHINLYNKIRFLIVYAIYRKGIIKADFYKLLMFSIPEKADSIMSLFENFTKLNLPLIKPSIGASSSKKNTYFGINNTQELTERYVPAFTNIISRLAYNNLSETYDTKSGDTRSYEDVDDDDSHKTFPYVKLAPISSFDENVNGTAISRNQPRWKNTKQSTSELTRQKLIVFSAGGLTQSELSTIASLESKINRNIFIGTDEVYSTWDMLGDIRMIDDEFEFPLHTKCRKREVPRALYDNSALPEMKKKEAQVQQNQQNRIKEQQAKSSNVSGNNTGNVIVENGGKNEHEHHHYLRSFGSITKSMGLSGKDKTKKVEAEVEEEIEEEKPKKKGLIKKFRKLGI